MDGRGDQGGAVAIIGMACRYPGAHDPAEFHDLVVAGRRLFQPVAGLPLHAALLDDWIVPPVSFGDPELGPQDLGPVQKLAAETTALALTDAGLSDPAEITRTGLIIASVTPSVCDLVRAEFGFAVGASYPAAAYQSSLHAVAAAASALQAGELDLAVAGGAELGIDPVWLALQARAGTLGTDEMRVYAADPAGLLPGEGCGIVVLARAADARAAGVPVYAELAGWSTTPASTAMLTGQAALAAYQQAGIDPADIQLIEGQGIGTAAGDSAELAALAQLRHGGRAVAALGAVSASIGYTKAAAGVASLVKTAVAMAAGTIPPGTGPARPHPLIESGEALLRLPEQPEAWPDGTRLAAVNSLGTADPAAMPGLSGLQNAEGVHLLLRRERETDRGPGRRRRAARGPAAPPPAPGPMAGPGLAAPGRHTGSARPAGPAVSAQAAASAQAAQAAVSAQATVSDQATVSAQTAPLQGETPRHTAGRPAGHADHADVFAFCGEDVGALAVRLDGIAASAAALSGAELRELARQLARATASAALPAAGGSAPLRVALTAATPSRLAVRAQYAARLLRTGGPVTVTEPGVHISAGAAGTVVLIFPGRAESPAAHSALFALSLEALGTLELLGVRPVTGVGYSLGEITGLVWAGSLPAAEAARLVAQCGQVLRACACAPAAMARITADDEVTRALCAPDRLHIAAYEGPRGYVLAGSTAGIRELARRALPLGVPVEVLGGTTAMHSPAMARCVAPLRSVFAGTNAAAPRRRLISTITGHLITADDDIAELLARQVSLPVLFAQAMAQAARGADLIVVAGPDARLAAVAAECSGVPAVAVPVAAPPGAGVRTDAGAAPPAEVAGSVAALFAALFAAGAVTDLTPFLSTPTSADVLASTSVPRMRTAERAAPLVPHQAAGPMAQQERTGGRTGARSAKLN
jgi:enediyne polyketide synthase